MIINVNFDCLQLLLSYVFSDHLYLHLSIIYSFYLLFNF